MAFLSPRTQFSLLLTLYSSSWPSRTVLADFVTQLMMQSWSQNHCFRDFSCSHPALEIQRFNILGAGFSMPPGLSATSTDSCLQSVEVQALVKIIQEALCAAIIANIHLALITVLHCFPSFHSLNSFQSSLKRYEIQLCLGLANCSCLLVFRIGLNSQRQQELKVWFQTSFYCFAIVFLSCNLISLCLHRERKSVLTCKLFQALAQVFCLTLDNLTNSAQQFLL